MCSDHPRQGQPGDHHRRNPAPVSLFLCLPYHWDDVQSTSDARHLNVDCSANGESDAMTCHVSTWPFRHMGGGSSRAVDCALNTYLILWQRCQLVISRASRLVSIPSYSSLPADPFKFPSLQARHFSSFRSLIFLYSFSVQSII